MLDMIDITIDRRFLLAWANQDSIDANDAAAFPHHLDLFVAHVAFDVAIPPRVGVGNDQRFRGDLEDFVEAGRADVSEIDDYPEPLAFADYIPAERGQAIAGR